MKKYRLLISQRNHRMRFCYGAFSLLELMIVIALLTLIGMLSIGSYQTFNRFLIHSELDQLRMLLLCTRYQAMALHSTLSIMCNSTQHTYSLNQQTYHLKTAAFDYISGTMGPPGNPIQLISKAITFANDRINFYADGTVSAGTLYVTDKQRSNMYALTVAVNDFFNIRIYSYHQTWHLLQ